jgi:hypothetical protein
MDDSTRDSAIAATMLHRGFEQWPAGDGRMAWRRRFLDKQFLILSRDGGLYGDPAAAHWTVSVRTLEGETLQTFDNMVLTQAAIQALGLEALARLDREQGRR